MSQAPLPEALKRSPPNPLYPKLRPGPNGPGPEAVAGNQRARLYDAMVEMVVTRGYAGTSIKAVCALAGVSRRTFYDLFGGKRTTPKEACFLSAYEYVVGRTAHRVRAAYCHEREPQQRLCSAFARFAREAADQPKLARFALVESLGAGRLARAQMDRGRHVFEDMIGASLSEGPHGVTLPRWVVKGVVCGVERVTRLRLMDGDAERLPGLGNELLAWALSYRDPAAIELPAGSGARRETPVRRQPRSENDRVRIMHSAARIAARKGYAQLSPARIATAAGVSERRFDELFGSSEHCLLDSLDRMGIEALVSSAEASRRTADRLVGLHRGMLALMQHLASNPELVQIAFVEIFAVGPAGIERREGLLGKFTELLAGSRSRTRRPSDLVSEASVGAIWAIVQQHVTRGAARLLPGVAGWASYLALAPVIGGGAAVDVIRRAQAAVEDEHVASREVCE
jgi:AcrR family transcriptional regulator